LNHFTVFILWYHSRGAPPLCAACDIPALRGLR
jgi:hypothetical protein